MISFHHGVGLLAVQAIVGMSISSLPELHKSPNTNVTQIGVTVHFICNVIGNASWVINGFETNPAAYDRYERKGFNFSEYNLTISVVASLDINNTDIQCQIGAHSSQIAKIIIATPPLPPAPGVLLVNATVLQLSWEPPFTWSEYPVLNYTVRMHNTSSTEQCTWTRTISAAVNTIEVISSGNTVSLSYHELVFYVTARNDIGESCQGEVRGGFPVVPGEFNNSYITHEVCFQQSTGNPQLEIFFKSPQVCPTTYYRITITNSAGDYVTRKVGHNLMSGLLISERITSGLSLNQNYSLTLIAENLAGSNTPVMLHFNTNFHLPTNAITTTTAATPATDTMLFADPKDVTVEANQWAQFNCTVHCTHTRTVGWYMAGYDHAIKRNNTIPGLLIKRTSDSKCTSNQKIHYFEVYATEAWNKSTFYCAAYERHQKSCSCGKGGRCYSRPALLTVRMAATVNPPTQAPVTQTPTPSNCSSSDINSRLPTVATNDIALTVTANIANVPNNESTTTTTSTNVINAVTTDIITTGTTSLTVSHANTTSDGGTMDSFTVGTAVALGVVVAICISVAVFVGSIYFYRMHKGHSKVEKHPAGPMLTKPVPPMITNPIYNGPIYDIIATEPPKSPVKQIMSETPRYSNDPPCLPPPRKQSVNTSPVNESENEKFGASSCNELTPIGDEYTIMEPASVRMIQPTFPLDPKDEYVTMKS